MGCSTVPIIDELRSLNDGLWRPFVRAYADRDADAFLALASPDLVKAGGPGRQVQTFAGYAADTRAFFADLTSRGSRATIEFRFTERLVGADAASERGVFRIEATRADGDSRVFYGRFHTFSRRLDGRWRFVTDYDSDEAGSVDQSAFELAVPVDDVDAFDLDLA